MLATDDHPFNEPLVSYGRRGFPCSTPGGAAMSPFTFGMIVFVCVMGGGLFGTLLRGRLPERHLGAESKDLVRLTMGCSRRCPLSWSGC